MPPQTLLALGRNVPPRPALVGCSRAKDRCIVDSDEVQRIVPEDVEARTGELLEREQERLIQPWFEQILIFFEYSPLRRCRFAQRRDSRQP